MFKDKTILCLAPHTDDIELGCGATIARLSKTNRVIVHAFSMAQLASPGYTLAQLHDEFRQSCKVLGVTHCKANNFEVRRFDKVRQEILYEMDDLRMQWKPDLVFIPSPNDTHQDHAVIAREAIRMFKRTNLMCYESPWNNLQWKAMTFFEIEEYHLAKKLDALLCYESQKEKDYFAHDFIIGWARFRGTQAGVEYAECFENIRMVL